MYMELDYFWAIRLLLLVCKQAWRRDVDQVGPMAILMCLTKAAI